MKYRIVVLSDECGWVTFCSAFFDSMEAATAQKAIFMARYPDRVFAIAP